MSILFFPWPLVKEKIHILQYYHFAAKNAEMKKETRLFVVSLFLVRSTGLEPVWLPTRPSNVRVCLFRHPRKA